MTDRRGAVADPGPEVEHRCSGERGTGLVAAITLIFAFTFLGLVWLARDVDRGVSNRSTAQSIAFQAARSGAQAASIPALRTESSGDVGDVGGVAIDRERAIIAARRTASALFTSTGLTGSVTSVSVRGDLVSVTVTVTEHGVTVTGAGTVRAERAP